ncbi:uncharacterized protein YALI1_C20085g [Yarrowia lipolytica]|uniref:Uncharacterized protein n=1 Tax=Yarrowia lipolytica TaxID=4952 RepID=A0A1D8NB53_YARLL|nr:hypothetical protein YALI1_C20085g [Yarrowia lipolytica]
MYSLVLALLKDKQYPLWNLETTPPTLRRRLEPLNGTCISNLNQTNNQTCQQDHQMRQMRPEKDALESPSIARDGTVGTVWHSRHSMARWLFSPTQVINLPCLRQSVWAEPRTS